MDYKQLLKTFFFCLHPRLSLTCLITLISVNLYGSTPAQQDINTKLQLHLQLGLLTDEMLLQALDKQEINDNEYEYWYKKMVENPAQSIFSLSPLSSDISPVIMPSATNISAAIMSQATKKKAKNHKKPFMLPPSRASLAASSSYLSANELQAIDAWAPTMEIIEEQEKEKTWQFLTTKAPKQTNPNTQSYPQTFHSENTSTCTSCTSTSSTSSSTSSSAAPQTMKPRGPLPSFYPPSSRQDIKVVMMQKLNRDLQEGTLTEQALLQALESEFINETQYQDLYKAMIGQLTHRCSFCPDKITIMFSEQEEGSLTNRDYLYPIKVKIHEAILANNPKVVCNILQELNQLVEMSCEGKDTYLHTIEDIMYLGKWLSPLRNTSETSLLIWNELKQQFSLFVQQWPAGYYVSNRTREFGDNLLDSGRLIFRI